MTSHRSHHITSRAPSRAVSTARVPIVPVDLCDVLNECCAKEQTNPEEVQHLQSKIERLQKRQKLLDGWCK